MSNKRSPTEVDKIIGRNIRKARLESEMTLAEAGKELGLSHQQLQKYETGVNRLPASRMPDVAKVFKKPIKYFYNEPD